MLKGPPKIQKKTRLSYFLVCSTYFAIEDTDRRSSHRTFNWGNAIIDLQDENQGVVSITEHYCSLYSLRLYGKIADHGDFKKLSPKNFKFFERLSVSIVGYVGLTYRPQVEAKNSPWGVKMTPTVTE